MKAFCLGFVHVPDIGPVPFQIIVQKFVQRCDTHMEAQSYKVSYTNGIQTLSAKFIHNTNLKKITILHFLLADITNKLNCWSSSTLSKQ